MLTILTTLYSLSTLALALYTLGQLVLLLRYLRRGAGPALPHLAQDEWPLITIQLPIYNERHVIGRLLQAVTSLDYPQEKLHIQVLDDSTDATTVLVAGLVEPLRRQGWRIDHLHREHRQGYKAGALAWGLSQTSNPFIAIFDADFVPAPDFLRRTVPYLVRDAGLGIVQTAWGHLNADENWLTRAQRLATDAHFVIEQTARSGSGWFVPFNGTGGVWRVAAVQQAGGWSADTLTEDCDLSYRAQLAGWRALYLKDVIVPGELPPQIAAYRQQQARWAQGNTQCLRKLSGAVLFTPMRTSRRLMAFHHLLQYMPQCLLLLNLLVLPPLLISHVRLVFVPLGLISFIPPLLYVVSQQALYRDWGRHLLAFPALALLGTGLIARNSLAVCKGLLFDGGTFMRTPKFVGDWQASHYALRTSFGVLPELALGLYAAWGTAVALRHHPTLAPYMLLYVLAFFAVVGAQLVENWRLSQKTLIRPQINTQV
jgi:cellulose synthase/poly-beta-1,6-N-acetylglucosamine synthase-like glycosyltransferase